jgi:hypothetical protein
MSENVIQLSDRLRRADGSTRASAPRTRAVGIPLLSILFRVVAGALRASLWAVKTLAYLILVLFSGPTRFILGLSMFAAVLGLAFAFLGYRHDPQAQHHFLAIFAGVGLGATGLLVGYEYLLALLAPQPPIRVAQAAE